MTSITAHDSIQGAKDGQHQAIMEFVRRMADGGVYALTRKEIAKALGYETSTMSARCNELLKAESLALVGTKRCGVSGRAVGALSLAFGEGG